MTIDWSEVDTREKLLAVRARQLQRRKEDLEKAQAAVKASREKNEKWFDEKHKRWFNKDRTMQKDQLKVGDWVLVHNTQLDKQWSKKLDNHYLGPYKIRSVSDKGTYLLEEPDGTELSAVYAGEQVK